MTRASLHRQRNHRRQCLRELGLAEGVVFVATAVAAAFSVYFCMYAFRKPFDAVTFPGLHVWGTVIELKTACVLGQIFGYLLSKYLGMKFCSEVSTRRTGLLLVSLILGAEAALVLFALLPNAGKPAAVLQRSATGYGLGPGGAPDLEGRRGTEILLAGLKLAFVIADDATSAATW